MSGVLKRVWVLALMISLAAWSQAEICPMMLQGRATACGHATAATKPASSHYDCCPRAPARTKLHSFNVRLAMGDHGMPCSSLEPPPASAPKISTFAQQQVVVGVLHAFCPPALSQRRASADLAPSPGNPVFRLKEDLRV
jgi:hypothetical protein